jgi:hypothetical protein
LEKNDGVQFFFLFCEKIGRGGFKTDYAETNTIPDREREKERERERKKERKKEREIERKRKKETEKG